MLGALAHGLPQLILPQGADQFMNAAACQNARVALTLPPDEFSAHAVDAAARRLITEPEFDAAARRLITEPEFDAAASRIRAEINAMPTAADVLAGELGRATADHARRDVHGRRLVTHASGVRP